MTFKEKLINLRKIKGITQEEFAKAVGVSRQAVYKWESGQSYPEVTKLLEIKLLFGISIDDLLDDSYEVKLPEKKRRKKKSENTENTIKETLTPPTEVDSEISPAFIEVEEEAPILEKKTAEKEEVIEKDSPVKEETKSEKESDLTEEKPEEKKVGFFGRLFGKK